MTLNFETQYLDLVLRTALNGERREGRNGLTRSAFNEAISFDAGQEFPLLTTRRIYFRGVLGELAAFVRGPKSVADFEEWGCNYWSDWADPNGALHVDYGNKWIDWGGHNQLATLVDSLTNNPNSRRHLLTSWDPPNVDKLSLPCCHHTYQFYVRAGNKLDLHWMQRSTDVMIGLPSDAVLAATMVIALAKETGLEPGRVSMSLGDTHIYESHLDGAYELTSRQQTGQRVTALYSGEGLSTFNNNDLTLSEPYKPGPPIKFEVVA